MSLIKNPFFRLNVIDELLGRRKWVKTTHIQKVIREKLGEDVSLRTIQNDMKDLKEDTRLGYFAPIEYDNKNKAYKYSDIEYSIKNFGLKHNEITAFRFYAQRLSMFSGYSLFDDFSTGLNKIIQGVDIRSRITKEVNPQQIIQTDTLLVGMGQEFLGDAVFAIDNQYRIELNYQGFDKKASSKRVLFPYLIKEYKHRWYLLAAVPKEEKIKTFAFDRIQDLQVIEESFTKSVAFDADDYFKHSFGITTPNEKVEEIVLRFDKSEAPYVKSLPIHPTQTIIKETTASIDVSIKARISYELREFILSKTPCVKVVRPKALATEISNMLSKGQKKYSSKSSLRK